MAALAIPDPSQGPLTAGIAGIDHLGLSLASRALICQRITCGPPCRSPTPPLPLTLRRMVPLVPTQVGAPTCGGEVEVLCAWRRSQEEWPCWGAAHSPQADMIGTSGHS
jgi:hypothetical protein